MLFVSRYEQVVVGTDSKLKEAKDSVKEVKSLLDLNMEKRESYEKEHYRIMDTLNISKENGSFIDILPAINRLKESLNKTNVQNEANLLSIAQVLKDCLEPWNSTLLSCSPDQTTISETLNPEFSQILQPIATNQIVFNKKKTKKQLIQKSYSLQN